ncbi:conserved Plasmodium protein, unknown function [Plasmodium ovale]|uniref:Sexual stage-specific protein G37 n=1 Tax=Plasmodium ovale TaxID=36330 RepID=A0A1D3TLX7_PLAOA|nr:conserved Plasmodium protein, unknown function [Plasmodium ovale]
MKLLAIFILSFLVFYEKRTVVQGVIRKQDVYLDDDFKSFTYFFASSPSANFLSRIVHSDESRFVQTKNKIDIWSKTVDKAYSINQVSSEIMKVYISILLLLLLPYFAYIGIFGHARSQATLTLSSVLAYFTLLVMFFLTNGILNIGFVASIPPVFAFFVLSLVNSDCTIKSLYRYTRYVFCFVLSKLIYDVVTNLSGDGTNSFDYGPSGFVYMNLLRGNYYFVLKFVHLTILTLLSFIFVKLFPSLFGDSSLKSPMSMKLDKYIVAFLCALPVATSFTQIFYLASNTINPIDPSTFFMIPSSVNFSSTSTIFSLTIWVVTTCILAFLRNRVETDYSHILNKIPNRLSEFL